MEELFALLLACQTVAELKALKKTHGRRVFEAYCCLSPEQQHQVDAVAATAVPYEVYKYTGPAIERDGQRLRTGVLVYIDPNARIHKGSVTVPVWLMRGATLGWRQALSVSRSCLTLVEKAVTVVTEVIESEPGNLLDGLA